MGVDFEAVLVVGYLQSDLIVEQQISRQVPVFNRHTGEREGFETEHDCKYTIGNVEIPDGMSATEYLHDMGFAFTPMLADREEMVIGEIIATASASDDDSLKEVTTDFEMIQKTINSVSVQFEQFGIKTPPKVYLAFCAY